MLRSKFLSALIVTTFIMATGIAEARAQFWPARSPAEYLYSIDIGSDWDFSDPLAGSAPNLLDAGNVYQGAPDPAVGLPVLFKDDDLLPGDGVDTRPSVWLDQPFSFAANPPAATVPAFPGATPNFQNYLEYYDLDAEDQLAFDIRQYQDTSAGLFVVDRALVGSKAGSGLWPANPTLPGNILISFDDDFAPGWTSGDVPTTVAPDRAFETFQTASDYLPKTPVFSAPAPLPDKLESALLLPDDPGLAEDDDVDALDWIPSLTVDDSQALSPLPFRYHSADHEAVGVVDATGASVFLDPGDIYLTIDVFGMPNAIPVLDDVIHFGVSDDTDIDAFEFVALTIEEYERLFDQAPVVAGDTIIAGLFSVDENDPDNDPAGGIIDESGGLSPYAVYITNFAGANVPITNNFGFFDESLGEYVGDDIDAITIPEPASAMLFGLGALAVLRRRRA